MIVNCFYFISGKSVYVEYPRHWSLDSSPSVSLQRFYQSPGLVTGVVDKAWNFSSHSQCINMTSELNQSDCYLFKDSCVHGFTVSLMLKFISLNDTNQMIFTLGGDNPDGYGLYLEVAPNNMTMEFRRYFHMGYRTVDKEYSVWFNVQYQEWTQIVVTYYTRFGLNVLVDGAQAGHSSGSPRPVSLSPTFVPSFLIGCSSSDIMTYPNFLLDEINLWDKAWVDIDQNSTVGNNISFVY